MRMSKYAVFIDCNSIAFTDWCSGASLGVTRVAYPRGKPRASAALAAERKVGQIMEGRGNWPTTVVDVQHVLANSDIRIFRIHFWQALCQFTAF